MPTIQIGDLLALIGLAKVHLERGAAQGGAVAAEASRVLSRLGRIPPLDGNFARNRHPATRHLKAAYDGGVPATADLLAAIRPVGHHLPWYYSYAKRGDAPGLERNMAFAEIIGPAAPFRSGEVSLGLTLIGPETLYPAHAHPAIELYYVVAGTAQWTASGVSQNVPPGGFVLHPSQAVHSMKTGREPLLALYTWSGDDIQTTSYYTHE